MGRKRRRRKRGKGGEGRGVRPRQAEAEEKKAREGGPPRLDLTPVLHRERDWLDVAGKAAAIMGQLAKVLEVVVRHWP